MKTIMFGLIMFMTPALSNAEPDTTIRYLMDKKVSMFSFGLYRMEKLIEQSKSSLGPEGTINVFYDWDLNRIIISSMILSGFLSKEKDPNYKERCSKEIDSIRLIGRIFPSKGTRIFDQRGYSDLFSIIGYTNTGTPDKLYDNIDNIIEIRITILGKNKKLTCEGPLVSTKILYEEIIHQNDNGKK